MSDARTPEQQCTKCRGTGEIDPPWPVGPGGAHLSSYKCSRCGGSGVEPNTTSPPVMNSPADEAEARDRAHGAPRQADPAAPGRGESGLTSGSEARPVTPTAHHLASNTSCAHTALAFKIDAQGVTRWHCANCLRTFNPSGDTEIEQACVRLRIERDRLRIALEGVIYAPSDEKARLAACLRARAILEGVPLSGEPAFAHETNRDAADAARYRWLKAEDRKRMPLATISWRQRSTGLPCKLADNDPLDALIDAAITSPDASVEQVYRTAVNGSADPQQ